MSCAWRVKQSCPIIGRCDNGEWEFRSSDVLFDELNDITDFIKKLHVLQLCNSAASHIELTEEIISRAKELEKFNIKPYDALHLASAEKECVDVFLTTDLKLLKAVRRSDTKLNVKNPLVWFTEVLTYEL